MEKIEKFNELSQSIKEKWLEYFQEIKKEIIENSQYLLESDQVNTNEEKIIKALFDYLVTTYSTFGQEQVEIETNKFERCYNFSFKTGNQYGAISTEVVLTYTVTTKYRLGIENEIIPVVKINTKKSNYNYKDGEIESTCCHDILEICSDGVYGYISNSNNKGEYIKTLFRGDVIIPDDTKKEATRIPDFSIVELLWLGLSVNLSTISNDSTIVVDEKKLSK